MPNQGDGAQEKGKSIAAAFEKGVTDPNRDFTPAIQALQDASRGSTPEEQRQVLAIANQLLDRSANPNVKKFFGTMDIEGSDSQGIKLKHTNGKQFILSDKGKATEVGTGASVEATTRDAYGNRIEKATNKDGVTRERMVTADGSTSVEKYTDKNGNKWEVESRRQADNSLRPTKVTMPDGSIMEYEWKREMGDHGTLYPTRMKETDKGGRVVRDLAMKTVEGHPNRLDTAHWERRVGTEPADKDYYGGVVVDTNGNSTLTFRNPYMTEKVNADGNWSKSGVDKNLKRIDEKGRRTK